MDYYKLVRNYYLDIFDAEIDKLTKQKKVEIDKLIKDIEYRVKK